MTYTKHTWTDGELITKEKLNNMEVGIENANSKTVPDATTGAKGIVKMAAKVDAVSTANATAAEDAYTKATIQKVVDLTNANKTTINAIITALKNAGIMSNS